MSPRASLQPPGQPDSSAAVDDLRPDRCPGVGVRRGRFPGSRPFGLAVRFPSGGGGGAGPRCDVHSPRTSGLCWVLPCASRRGSRSGLSASQALRALVTPPGLSPRRLFASPPFLLAVCLTLTGGTLTRVYGFAGGSAARAQGSGLCLTGLSRFQRRASGPGLSDLPSWASRHGNDEEAVVESQVEGSIRPSGGAACGARHTTWSLPQSGLRGLVGAKMARYDFGWASLRMHRNPCKHFVPGRSAPWGQVPH